MLNDLVDGEVQGSGVDQADSPFADHVVDGWGQRLARNLLEGDHNPRFAPAHPFSQETGGQNGFAGAGGSGDQ